LIKRLLFAVLAVALSFGVILVALEIGLRFLPVETGFSFAPVHANAPVMHAAPDKAFVSSVGWDFQLTNRGRVNNAGFVNDRDYDPSAASLLLAVVGDSYIEAKMVPYVETVQGRLASAVKGRGRVYSFGFSGAPLSQYLIWAHHAWTSYRPDGIVINVVANDFDESMAHIGTKVGFHQYVDGPNGPVLTLVPYDPPAWRDALKRSALARYLIYNLKVLDLYGFLQRRATGEGARAFSNVAAEPTAVRMDAASTAIAAFFRDLPAMHDLTRDRILFVVDGLREAIYDPALAVEAAASYAGRANRLFMEAARAEGYTVIDMHAEFSADYAARSQYFEYPTDGHWSGVGHGVAADAIARSPLFRALFGTTIRLRG
jgi:hypothetical protein